MIGQRQTYPTKPVLGKIEVNEYTPRGEDCFKVHIAGKTAKKASIILQELANHFLPQIKKIQGLKCWVTGTITLPGTSTILASCEAILANMAPILKAHFNF